MRTKARRFRNTLKEFKEYIEEYARLVLLCVNSPDVLDEFCGARGATEVLVRVQSNHPQVWQALHGLTTVLNRLDRFTGNRLLPPFRYEFTTAGLEVRKPIIDPPDCIDYVYSHHNAPPWVYRPMPMGNVAFDPHVSEHTLSLLLIEIVRDLNGQKDKYFRDNGGRLSEKGIKGFFRRHWKWLMPVIVVPVVTCIATTIIQLILKK